MFLSLYVHLSTRLHREEAGQTTAEYALVLLGAASVALLLAVWARDTGRLGRLLDAVVDSVIDMVE
jgi:Flp pilus assembly pilin Flp